MMESVTSSSRLAGRQCMNTRRPRLREERVVDLVAAEGALRSTASCSWPILAQTSVYHRVRAGDGGGGIVRNQQAGAGDGASLRPA